MRILLLRLFSDNSEQYLAIKQEVFSLNSNVTYFVDSIEYYLFGGERPYYKVSKGKVWFMLPEKRI